jgi:hypothetical protein
VRLSTGMKKLKFRKGPKTIKADVLFISKCFSSPILKIISNYEGFKKEII